MFNILIHNKQQPCNLSRVIQRILGVGLLALFTVTVHSATLTDSDKDGIADVMDNCTKQSNPKQTDGDNDGIGNLCDADLNNDNKITVEDDKLWVLAAKKYTTDKKYNFTIDLNDDGVIDDSDRKMLLAALNSRIPSSPGPTALVFSKRFMTEPPRVESLAMYQVEGSQLPSQQNVAMVRFSKISEVTDTVTIAPIDKPLVFNDLGLLPDVKAGDGSYAAFINIDLKQRDTAISRYAERLTKIKSPTVLGFNGRAVISQDAFDLSTIKNTVSSTDLSKITLTDGRILIPITPGLDPLPLAASTNPLRTLGVNDLSIVKDVSRTFNPCLDGNFNTTTSTDGDVNGAWSFKTLMKNMSGTAPTDTTAKIFINNWLKLWMTNQTVNTFTINARTNIQNFFPGWDGVNASSLNIDKLPFRLLAIMNRIDLGQSTAYGGGKPGEIRFVFGLVKPTAPGLCASRPMTVILEYGDTARGCSGMKTRAQQWVALDALPFPSAAYNTALQVITDDVTAANTVPSKANGNAINQIRSNDFTFSQPWQLREFTFPTTASTFLAAATIKQTPDEPLYNTDQFGFPGPRNNDLTDYLEQNANAILLEKHIVNETHNFSTGLKNFLGASVEYVPADFWKAPINTANLPGSYPLGYKSNMLGFDPNDTSTMSSELMHKFSINTCDDCHAGETGTSFTHVSPTSSAVLPAQFSSFMTGIGSSVVDPRGSGDTREFNDFARRSQIMDSLAVKTCGFISMPPIMLFEKFNPPILPFTNFTH